MTVLWFFHAEGETMAGTVSAYGRFENGETSAEGAMQHSYGDEGVAIQIGKYEFMALLEDED